MRARSVAILGLCGGSYLLGIATSLLLVEFSQFPDTWQHVTTLVLAALAVIILATSVALILQPDDVPDGYPPGAGAVCASREESVTQTMPSVSFRNEPYGAVRDPGFVEAGRNTGNREGPDAVAVVLPPSVEGGEVPGPQPGILGDELRPPATEPAGTGEPPRTQEPQAADLIRVWDNYRRTGDGHFNAQGFQRQLDDQRLEATVLDRRTHQCWRRRAGARNTVSETRILRASQLRQVSEGCERLVR